MHYSAAVRYPDSWYADVTTSSRFYSLAATINSSIIGIIISEMKPRSRCNREVLIIIIRIVSFQLLTTIDLWICLPFYFVNDPVWKRCIDFDDLSLFLLLSCCVLEHIVCDSVLQQLDVVITDDRDMMSVLDRSDSEI